MSNRGKLSILLMLFLVFPFITMEPIGTFVDQAKQTKTVPETSDLVYEVWNRTSGGEDHENGNGIWVDDTYIYTLNDYAAFSPIERSISIMKWEKQTGSLIWNISHSNSLASGRCIWGNGTDIYVGGYTSDFPSKIVLIKYTSAGDLMWEVYWDVIDNNDLLIDIWGDNDGQYIYTLGSTGYNSENDVLLIKWDNMGNQIWNNTWNGAPYDYALALWGNVNYLYGTGSSGISGTDQYQNFVIKWDKDGNQIWNRTWGKLEDSDWCYGVWGYQSTIYTTGISFNETNLVRMSIAKWDSDGNQVWNTTWRGTGHTYSYDVWACEDCIFTAGAVGQGYDGKPLLNKWDTDGNLLWINNMSIVQNGSIWAITAEYPESPTIYTVGSTWDGHDNNLILAKWYDAQNLPNISVTPIDGSIVSSGTSVEIDVVELYLDAVRIRWDSGSEVLFHDSHSETQVPIGDGAHTLEIWANNTGSTAYKKVEYIVDDTAPIIEIIDPLNNSRHRFAPYFDLDVDDPHKDTIYYTINDGISFIIDESGVIDEDIWDSLENGVITLEFYANDTLGHLSNVEITLEKTTRILPGYRHFIPITVIMILGMSFWVLRQKIQYRSKGN